MKKKNIFTFLELLLGIVLMVVAILVFSSPDIMKHLLGYLLAILAIIQGGYFIYLYLKNRDFNKTKANTYIVIGVIFFIAGIIFMVKPGLANTVFAFLFIYVACINVISLPVLKKIDLKLLILGAIADLILLVFGVLILIKPWVGSLPPQNVLLGVALLLSGLLCIVFSITGRKNSEKEKVRKLH